jgi:uncharacterized protein (TIGR02145 family)
MKTYGSVADDGGKTYKTVVIGTQTWMAENLNYNVSGSKCGSTLSGIGTLSDADATACNIYGRLYNWAKAMGFVSDCNLSFCTSQISAKHKGVCPSGWHIPSDADWNVLMAFIHEDKGLGSFTSGTSSYAGKYLKATSRWSTASGHKPGTDDYGFSALPGGNGDHIGIFSDVGYHGNWWSTSNRSSNEAHCGHMFYDGEGANWNYSKKEYLHSVRCVKD